MSDAALDLARFEPVTKVGAVILREVAGGAYDILLCQPKGKGTRPGLPAMGLVRGTRQYRDPITGAWVDAARDGSTQPANVIWEAPIETLAREAAEEAGLAPAMLHTQAVFEMGVRLFDSANKPPYPLHWFVVVLDKHAQATLPHDAAHGLEDSLATRWVSLAEMRALSTVTDTGLPHVSPGYIPVVEEAMAGLNASAFAAVIF